MTERNIHAGDHLVGWAASSLRWPSKLPAIEAPPGCGVVLEDPLDAGFHAHLLAGAASRSTVRFSSTLACPLLVLWQYCQIS